MKTLSKNSFFKIFFVLFTLVIVAKIVALVALWLLPAMSVNMPHNTTQASNFYRTDFHNLILPQKYMKRETQSFESAANMQDFILHGLYGTSKEGYAIIASKTAPNKTAIIAVGESYKGFKLQGVFLNYVVFVRNGKKYILHLQGNITKKGENSIVNNTMQNDNGVIDVQRSDIDYYSKNIAQIWRDVSINEIGRNGNLQGFRVTKIRPNSKIARLGLQKGDIILEVNGKKLKSYSDVLQIYQNINKLDAINLLVKRGNTQKEIYYEIN